MEVYSRGNLLEGVLFSDGLYTSYGSNRGILTTSVYSQPVDIQRFSLDLSDIFRILVLYENYTLCHSFIQSSLMSYLFK